MACDRSRLGLSKQPGCPNGEVVVRLTPELQKRIEKSFGINRDEKKTGVGFGKCPGETDCSDFKKSRGDSREEKEKNACVQCPKFPTKPKTEAQIAETGDRKVTSLFARVFRLRQERISGFPPSKAEMTGIEYELILAVDTITDRCRRESDFLIRSGLEEASQLQQMILAKLMAR